MTEQKMIWNTENALRLLPWMLLFFTLPVFPFLVSASIVLIVLSLLFQIRRLRWSLSKWPALAIPVIIYFAYLAGIAGTETEGAAAIVLERKLSFLVFPVLFLVIVPFTVAERKLLLRSMLAGALLHSIISLAGAAVCYKASSFVNYFNGNRNCFFSSAFSFELHPSYIAFYNVFLISFLGIEFIDGLSVNSPKKKVAVILVICWLSFILFLLASKSGLLSFAVAILFLLFYFVVKRKKIRQAIIAFVLLAAVATGSMFFTSVPLERFKSVFASSGMAEKELFEKYRTTTESTPVRKMIWICAKEIIQENPLGVGSGDANTALMKKYEERGMTGALNRELNAHNQYFQVSIALGYAGLLLIVIFLAAPLVIAIRKKDPLMGIFILLASLNLAVESMFETQAGVVFIVLAWCFLITAHSKRRTS